VEIHDRDGRVSSESAAAAGGTEDNWLWRVPTNP